MNNASWESKLNRNLKHSALIDQNVNFRVIIELAGDDDEQVKSLVLGNHGTINREMKALQMVVAEVPASLLPKLAELDQVKMILQDFMVKICE